MDVLMSYLKTHIFVTTTQINKIELLKYSSPQLPPGALLQCVPSHCNELVAWLRHGFPATHCFITRVSLDTISLDLPIKKIYIFKVPFNQ